MKVFVSYNHQQAAWVRGDLVPCLDAGGAEVIFDHDDFKAGPIVREQMDAHQDRADMTLAILSPEYIADKSVNCRHELERAIAKDPTFQNNKLIIVMRQDCPLPPPLNNATSQPLYVNLTDDTQEHQWQLLMNVCGADLGVSPVQWLAVRNDIKEHLTNGTSVNLVVYGKKTNWRGLLKHLRKDHFPEMGEIDLGAGITTRQTMVAKILNACGITGVKVPKNGALAVLNDKIENSHHGFRLIFKHFDDIKNCHALDETFFSALRYLVSDARKLILLIQSRIPFEHLIPKDHPLSTITSMKTVELRGDEQ